MKLKSALIPVSLALLSLLLGSCAKSEVVQVNDWTREINFSSYTGRPVTKAQTTYTGTYNVAAWYGTSKYFVDVFKNGSETYTGASPVTTTVYYWPTDVATNNLKFYAVAPSSSYSFESDGKTVKCTSDGSADLLTATSATYDAYAASVSLVFTHSLSRISSVTLQPQSSDGSASSEYTYKVTSFKIVAKNSGTYDFSTPGWTLDSTTGDYVYISEATPFAGNTTLTPSLANLKLLPQDVTLEVTYEIIYNGETVMTSTTKTGTLTIEQGKSYSVTVTLPNDNESSKVLSFSSTVTDWTNGGTVTPIS